MKNLVCEKIGIKERDNQQIRKLKSPVLIFQQIVPAYRVPVFREMSARLKTILCHSTENKSSKICSAANTIDFPNEILFNKDNFGTNQKVKEVLKKYRPKVVIAGVAASNFTFLKLLLLRKKFKYKLIAWGHVIHNKEIRNPLAGKRGKLMRYYLKKADAIVFYCDKRRKILSQTFPQLRDKCFVAHNTLDLSENRALFEKLEKQGKEKVKANIKGNFTAQYNIIFVGRLLPDKGIQLLLDAHSIAAQQLNVNLHIVGTGDMESTIKEHKLYNSKVFHYGAIYEEQINAYFLYVSDLFVMPGYVGLSVIHAFSYGLPVITCKTANEGPFHSPEIENVKHTYNGFLCESNANDLANTIINALQDSDLQLMSKNAVKTAYTDCSLNNMLMGFRKAIDYVQQ